MKKVFSLIIVGMFVGSIAIQSCHQSVDCEAMVGCDSTGVCDTITSCDSLVGYVVSHPLD